MPKRKQEIRLYVNQDRREAFENLQGQNVTIEEVRPEGAAYVEHTVPDKLNAFIYTAIDRYIADLHSALE